MSNNEQIAAESFVNQYAIAVLLTHIAPAEADRAADRLTESEFAEYLRSVLGTLSAREHERIILHAKPVLDATRETFLTAGNTRPWLLMLGSD